jgi:hypothetical protein
MSLKTFIIINKFRKHDSLVEDIWGETFVLRLVTNILISNYAYLHENNYVLCYSSEICYWYRCECLCVVTWEYVLLESKWLRVFRGTCTFFIWIRMNVRVRIFSTSINMGLFCIVFALQFISIASKYDLYWCPRGSMLNWYQFY